MSATGWRRGPGVLRLVPRAGALAGDRMGCELRGTPESPAIGRPTVAAMEINRVTGAWGGGPRHRCGCMPCPWHRVFGTGGCVDVATAVRRLGGVSGGVASSGRRADPHPRLLVAGPGNFPRAERSAAARRAGSRRSDLRLGPAPDGLGGDAESGGQLLAPSTTRGGAGVTRGNVPSILRRCDAPRKTTNPGRCHRPPARWTGTCAAARNWQPPIAVQAHRDAQNRYLPEGARRSAARFLDNPPSPWRDLLPRRRGGR